MATLPLLFLTALVVGVVIAIPVGPIAILTVRRTLQFGPITGYASGIGAALADGTWTLVASTGLTAVEDFIRTHDVVLRLVGALILAGLAWSALGARPDFGGGRPPGPPGRGLVRACATSAALTFSNPLTLFGIIAALAAFGIGDTDFRIGALATVTGGVTLGSAAWWCALVWMAGRWRGYMTTTLLVWVNRVAAAVLGLAALVSLLGIVFPDWLSLSH